MRNIRIAFFFACTILRLPFVCECMLHVAMIFSEDIPKMHGTCPICLDDIKDTDNVLQMPGCLHKIHTTCGLNAVQYDVRCPICRTQDPALNNRQEEQERVIGGAEVYLNIEGFEALAREHVRQIRNYRQRRNRIINNNSKLKRLREALKREERSCIVADKEVEKEWLRIQRESWKTNPGLAAMKKERQKKVRRRSNLHRKLNKELESVLGTQPDDLADSIFRF